ncbi:MAG: hypothetical protein UY39_C0035G0006 [Candidatus Kaiserbacteria bacterium GW2011_GWC2_49_12]|uniref:Uncharacterized protein n=1 Tax=Candidatus Kaiserbacteria bacterium GW2011_GWC2_49_12 TaxID=1618675 RepID=A0A0G1VJQ4_9BACT|nr:MAG: hypothetical protein UY39_C0035G0006 [Candidatus Kaiserbacteria bacterium GW2011_GWC2_49_12]HCM44032.1 hypothetical protein [Candidatus Kaiserbacteria bacterium]
MGLEEKYKMPQNIEDLDEQELTQRLCHQLSLVYDRVFLTGDWKGELAGKKQKEIRENLFEDIVPITDPAILADALGEFLDAVEVTLPTAVTTEELRGAQGGHDASRLVFAETIRYVRRILNQYRKDVGTKEFTEMAKCIDENIHFFRDISVSNMDGVKGAVFSDSIKEDEERVEEGLRKINNRLSKIFDGIEKHKRSPDDGTA